jgi:signal transduction histidine kinase
VGGRTAGSRRAVGSRLLRVGASLTPEEQLLFAGTRLRVIRLALWVGWASLLAIFAGTLFHTAHIEETRHVVIWVLVAAAVLLHSAMYLIPWRRLVSMQAFEWILYGWVAAVIGFVTLLLYLSGPFASDFYLVYILLIMFAAAAFRIAGYAAIVATAIASYLIVASVGGSPRDLILRIAAILLTALMAGYLAAEQRAKARNVARLHKALVDVAAEHEFGGLRRAAATRARHLTDASVAALVPASGDGEAVVDPPDAVLDLGRLPIQEAAAATSPTVWERGAGPEGAVLVSLGSDLGVLLVQGTTEAFSATHRYLLETLAAQTRATMEVLRLNEGLQRKEQARAALVRRLISAQEEERRRIARELHDGINQDLAGLVLGLEALERGVTPVDPAELKAIARSASDELRRVVHDLRPRVLDDLGLLAALRWLAKERYAGLNVALDVDAEAPVQAPLDTAVFRIVQEALTNAQRHAGAMSVSAALRTEGGVLCAIVEDDGRGFDPVAPTSGAGIVGMRERAEQLGGTLSVSSRPGGGTRVALELPLQEE